MAANGGTSKSDKMWRREIMLAVNRTAKDGKRKRLEVLAERLVRLALQGDLRALQEIGDRVDGRPKQETEIGGPDGGPVAVKVNVNFVGAKDGKPAKGN